MAEFWGETAAPPSPSSTGASVFGHKDVSSQLTTFTKEAGERKLLLAAFAKVGPLKRLPEALQTIACDACEPIDANDADRICIAGKHLRDSFFVVGSGRFLVSCLFVGHDKYSIAEHESGDVICESNLHQIPEHEDLSSIVSITCDAPGRIFRLSLKAFKTIRQCAEDHASAPDDVVVALGALPLCAGLASEELTALAAEATPVLCACGEPVLASSDPCTGVLVLLGGSLTLPLPQAVGEERADTITLTVGDVVDESGLAQLASPTAKDQQGEAPFCTATSALALLRVPEAALGRLPAQMRWHAEHSLFLKILKGMEAFRVLTDANIEALLRASTMRSYEAGDVVSARDQAVGGSFHSRRASLSGVALFVVLSGSVTVTRPDDNDATRSEVLGGLGVGAHFGAKNVVDPTAPREVDVTADTPLTCLLLDTRAFGELMPLVQHSLRRELANRRWILENRNKVALSELREVRTIGLGSFGRVKLVVHAPSGRPYALKQLRKRDVISHHQVEATVREQKLLSTCSHPFLLKLAAAFQTSHTLYMVLEFIQAGELFSRISATKDGLELSHGRFYAAAIAAALTYLHSLSIAFRDLKPENILIDRPCCHATLPQPHTHPLQSAAGLGQAPLPPRAHRTPRTPHSFRRAAQLPPRSRGHERAQHTPLLVAPDA